MRFQRLEMRPYGTFRDYALPFSSDVNLHLIFGTNGAGKSTTLEALRSSLFGLRQEKRVHASSDLRVGATLQHSSGDTTSFLRRTSKKAPLWTPDDDEALPPETLAPYLGNLTRDRFQTLFGLDHESMVRGGRELLNGDGDMGKALFGAMLGGQQLAEIHGRLESDRKRLYVDQSSKGRISQRLRDRAALVKEQKESSVKPSTYAKDRKELKRLEELRAEGTRERRLARTQLDALSRRVRALRWTQQLQEKERERESLDVERPLGAVEARRTLALLQESTALAERGDERSRDVQGLEADLAEATTGASKELLQSASEIDSLMERRGAFRDAGDTLPALEEELAKLRAMRPGVSEGDEAGSAALKIPEGATLETLTADSDRRIAELAELTTRLRFADEAHAKAKALAEQQGASIGQLDATLPTSLAEEILALEPFRGSLEELRALELPSPAAAEAREAEEREEAAAAREHASETERARAEEDDAKDALAKLVDSEGAPPTEAELEAARLERNGLLREALKGAPPKPEEVLDLERAVQAADQLADLRATESARAAERDALEARVARASLQVAQARAALEASKASAEASQGNWSAALAPCGLSFSASELAAWQRQRTAVLNGESSLRREAQETLQRRQEEEALARAEREAAHRALDDSTAAWAAWTASIGLGPEPSPETVQSRLRGAASADAMAREASRLGQDFERLSAQVSKFDAEVAALADRLELLPSSEVLHSALEEAQAKGTPERVAVANARTDILEGALRRAREEATRAAELRTRLEAERGKAAAAATRAKEVAASLEAVRTEARCADNRALARLAEASGRAAALDKDIADLRTQLELDAPVPQEDAEKSEEDSAEGSTDEQATEAELASAIRLAEERIEELDEELTQLSLQEGEVRGRVEGDGSPAAARLAARIAEIDAELIALTEEFLSGRIAAKVLAQEIEHHRMATHGPLLARAQDLFKTLTLGAYERLHPSESRGKKVMVARRPDDRQVSIEEMSSGTCDQLYLALRIASVEQMLKTTEPMPFIADDLFVNFDDRRTEAALRVLAELSKSTQVIVFSHHESVVATAERLADGGVPVEVHRLMDERSREAARVDESSAVI